MTKGLTKQSDVFKTNEICRILKACREAGVSKLKLGDLEVEFSSGSPPANLGLTENQAYQNTVSQFALPENKASSDKLALVDRQILEDIERTQVMIDDPLSYEDQMINDQLGNSRQTDGNARFTNDRDREDFFS